jgi:hypothetical protein
MFKSNHGTTFLTCVLLASNLAAATAQDPDKINVEAGSILNKYCYRCHRGQQSSSSGRYSFSVRSVETMIDESMIVKGSPPEDSDLFNAIHRGRMPPKNQAWLPRPSAAEVEIIRKWIADGAAEFPPPPRRPFISFDAQMRKIRQHFQGMEKENSKNFRYFTLSNLWNDPGCDDRHLRMARGALAKALNSLSWEPKLVVPEAIDSEKTIYAVDISKLGWTEEHWSALLEEYPYAIDARSIFSERDSKVIDDLDLRQIDEKHIRVDWFVSIGLRPKLYHKLLYELEIPDLVQRAVDPKSPNNPKRMTDRDLEKFLNVPVETNIFGSPAIAKRAGYNESGISGQNRMIERHPHGENGFYWKSYDFLGSNSKAILTEFPLGPQRNDKDDFAFHHDGGEIIFDLPNGLQGYLLATGRGDRLDAGPIEIVGDALKTSGNQLIVNGLSCIVCHRRGMVEPPNDEVRAASGYFGAIRDTIRELYPEHDSMRELVEADAQIFWRAIEELVSPFLLDGEDATADLDGLPEPVGEVARQYLLNPMNLDSVAAELFHSDVARLAAQLQTDSQVRKLGIGQLRNEDGTIKREAWHSIEGRSLMQQAAEVLGFAPPTYSK